MVSFLDSLEDEEKTGTSLDLPDQEESSFLDTLDDEGTEETPLPIEDQRPKISAWEPTVFDKMRNIFRDPEKEAAKAAIAMIDSKMLDISPSQAMRLRGPIDRGKKINPAAAKIDKTLTQRLGSKLDKGYAQVNSGLWNYDLLTGNENPEVVAGVKQTEEFLSQPEAISETVLEDAVGSAAEMFPFLSESMQRGGWRGVILAGGTILMGTAAGVPEITYPLAAPMYAIGQTSASLEFVSKVEAGLAYSELRNFKDPVTGEKIDPNIAKAASFGVGSINGLLELAQMKTLIKTIPGGKKLLSGLILDTVKEAVAEKGLQSLASKYAKRYGQTIVTETLQETAQESTNIVADIFSRKLTNELKGTDLSMPEIETIVNRLEQTIKTSAQAFAVMGIPGHALSAGLEAKGEKGKIPGAVEEPAKAELVVEPDTRTPQEKAVDQIIDTSFDRVTSIEEVDIDAEIEKIMADIERDEVAPEAPGEVGPKTQVFQESVANVVGEEEAVAVNTLLDARAKAVGMTTDEYIDFHGLEIVDGEKDGLPGDLSQIKENIEKCQVCDRLRRTPEGEDFWQDMMNTKEGISEDEFLENVIIDDILDEGETWEDYKTGLSDDIEFFKSENGATFFQTAGFEFIWKSKDEDPFYSTPENQDPEMLFQKQFGPAEEIKASVTFTDTKTIIRAFETADVSSLVHELGHVFRRDLGAEDLKIAEDWAGVVDGKWTVEAEEKFARGWENYLATGKAPTAELQPVFEKFKKWLTEIYKGIKGSSIDVEITPEIQGVFDRLLIPVEGVTILRQKSDAGKSKSERLDVDEISEAIYNRIDAKYKDIIDLPESNLNHAQYQRIINGSMTPRQLYNFIKKSKDPNISMEINAAIADTMGEIKETYRYEGSQEGRALEEYADELLEVSSKSVSDKDTKSKDGEKKRSVPSYRGIKDRRTLKQAADPSQTPIELLEEHFQENYIQEYSPEKTSEYEAALKKAIMLAEYNLDKIHAKEDSVSLKNIKDEAENIASSSGVFADWKAAIDEGGLNLESARSLSDKETVNTLMKRRPGLFKKGASFHAEHLSDQLGFDKPDDMFQDWLNAGTKKDAVASIMNDLIAEYEFNQEIGRGLTRREDLFDLENKELDKILMKKRPIKITELAKRNKLRAAIDKLNKLLAIDPGKRTATDIKNIKSLEAKKADIEKLIAEGGGFVESLPRADLPGIDGPVSTEIELKRSIMNARKMLAKGDKAGVAKERIRFQEIVKRATTRRKRSVTLKTLKSNIKKELRTAKVKKHTGKFTPEIQDTLDTLIRVSKMKPAEAEDKLVDNLEKYLDKDIPQEIVMENHMLEMVARLDTMDSIGGLESLLAEIKALKDEGRMINQLKKFNRESRDIARKDITVEELGGVPASIKFTGIKDLAPKTVMARAKQALKSHGKTIMGWDDLMDILSGKTKSKPGESFISKDNDLLGFKNAEKKGTRIAIDKMNADYKKAYGLETNRQVTKKMYEDNHDEITLKKVSLTDPIDGTAVEMDLVFTKAELRDRAMKLMDPTLEASFVEMGYNEDTKADIFEALTDQDKAFIENQFEFYRAYYDGVNEVYKEYNGINLPKNNMYSPLRREGVAKPVDDGMGEFLKETSFRASAANPGASKARTANTLTISKISDLSVMERHVAEMEHFKAWAEKIRDMNAVWKDPKVRAAVEINHGKNMVALVDNFVGDIANGASRMGQRLEGLDKYRSNIVKSMLAAKPAIMLKQLTSFVAFADKMPSGQFAKYMVQFWKNPVKNTKDLYSSEMLKARGKNIERDLKLAMQSKEHSAFAKHQSFFDMLMLNVQMGDQGAIVLGGWPYYKYLMDKKGLTHEQAITKMEKAAESSQQSGDITEQSAWQRGGSLAKLLTMFTSSQNQYIRKELGAVRNLFNGRQGIGQTMKTLLIFHIMLPMLFQFASDRFTWDEDEQKRAALFGSLNGYFIIGDALDYIIRYMLGMKNFNMEMPVYSAVHDFIKMTALVDLFDLSVDEAFKAFESLGGVLGVGTGLPLKQAVRTAKGAVDSLSGEYEKGFSELMGYSPYLSEKLAND